MLTDPLSITYAAAAKSMPRTGSGEAKSVYTHIQSDGTTFSLDLSHATTKARRERCVARLTRRALLANPLATGQSRSLDLTVSVTFDRDALHTAQEAVDLFSALRGLLVDAIALRLAGHET